jgi:hypothetical protein
MCNILLECENRAFVGMPNTMMALADGFLCGRDLEEVEMMVHCIISIINSIKQVDVANRAFAPLLERQVN